MNFLKKIARALVAGTDWALPPRAVHEQARRWPSELPRLATRPPRTAAFRKRVALR